MRQATGEQWPGRKDELTGWLRGPLERKTYPNVRAIHRDLGRMAAGGRDVRIDADSDVATSYRPRFNIVPTDQHFIVTSEFERRRVQGARWGLVNRRAIDNRRASQCINGKAETLEQRATFREAFHQRRCVVPADGFYEWTGPKSKRRPLWIHPRAGDLMLFGGLYESWYPERNKREVTFAIVTCAANAAIGEIHDRMPVACPPPAQQFRGRVRH